MSKQNNKPEMVGHTLNMRVSSRNALKSICAFFGYTQTEALTMAINEFNASRAPIVAQGLRDEAERAAQAILNQTKK